MSAYHDLSNGDLPLFRSKPHVEAPPYIVHNETSRAAAVSIRPVAGTLRARVLEAIERHGPLTDEAGCELTGMNPSTWRPRRVELERAGLIRAAGERAGRSGRAMTTWAAAGVGNAEGP